MPKLNSTGYAILGLLGLKPWSAYELVGSMKISILNRVWPRATSGVYNEPQKLVAHGFATAKQETNNGRKRTVYSITKAGRQALEEWLSGEGEQLFYQHEALLKLAFTEPDRVEAIHSRIQEIRQQALDEAAMMLSLFQRATPDGGQAGAPNRRLVISYIRHFVEARVTWANELEALLEDGPKSEVELYQRELKALTTLLEKNAR